MTTPAENQNWQKRQYDSFGPHFRIETANPELGACGNIAYNLRTRIIDIFYRSGLEI